MEKVKNIVVGAGITGLTIAERIASQGEEVLIIDKRKIIGGNCYDYFENGNYIQLYGPHIFHTNYDDVWNYLKRFTGFNVYSHKVLCNLDGKLVNIPFNLNSIELVFNQNKADEIKTILLNEIGNENKIPILQLKKNKNKLIRDLAEYVYKNIFLNYTVKQWGLKPDEIDSSVTGRVPVFVSKNDNYFQDKYQGLPINGFCQMFKKMISNNKIKIILNKDYKSIVDKKYSYEHLYYTGPLDYYFDYKFGKLKYRRIQLKIEKIMTSSYQRNSVINYPNDKKFTRITEFNKFLFIKNNKTIIAKEYSSWHKGFLAYPLQESNNNNIVNLYLNETKRLKNVTFIGRLAECRYYNMDQAVKKGLEITK